MESADGTLNAHSAMRITPRSETAAHAPKARVGSKEELRSFPLNTSFRDRLIGRLDEAGIPAHARTAFLAALTERAAQTVSRWLDRYQPGLPDLPSCERLCRLLPCSADWMLGLPTQPTARGRRRVTGAVTSGPGHMHLAFEALNEMTNAFVDSEPMRMSGDEMAPRIRDGDLVFVDRTADSLSGNGIYAVELDGRIMIRKIESRIGIGLVFRCENAAYEDCVIKDAAAARRMGLRVLGRVDGAIGVQRLKGG